MYKIGIVGFGVVGKSALAFLKASSDMRIDEDEEYNAFSRKIQVCIWDSRTLSGEEIAFAKKYDALLVDNKTVDLQTFIAQNDYILPSPGVSVQEYDEYSDKFLCELDFFASFFQWPVIAVTGSVGKTTTTKLIAKLASLGRFVSSSSLVPLSGKEKINAVVGGNIGVGMLDLIQEQDTCDVGVLELSSFQLELSRKFAPDIAVWTNMYPNHLDRHKTFGEYCLAKSNILRYQTAQQVSVLAKELFEHDDVRQILDTVLPSLMSHLIVYSSTDFDQSIVSLVKKDQFHYFYVRNTILWVTNVINHHAGNSEKVLDLSVLPEGTFIQNWVASCAALYFSGINFSTLEHDITSVEPDYFFGDQQYRVEHFATINGVDFFDDSKATLVEATRAAVDRLVARKRPLIVILGGLSKGATRTGFMEYMKTKHGIKKVYCFGPECNDFPGSCLCPSLQDIVTHIGKEMEPGDQVLFSPSGASFDFFKDYKHRGTVFKELVRALK
jgi:UDP-N-acetylmuramoylalanine--D-glutamate ligase